jgi:ABC-type Fe3+/spermidine/putrescine transport system ATPase subunit
MRTEIRQIQQRLGITSIYVTHDQEEAFSLADQVAIMNRGRLVQMGTPYELYHTPADQFVAEFVGLSNIVPVQVVEDGAQGTVIRCMGRTLPALRRLPNGALNAVGSTGTDAASTAAVLRPEALTIQVAADTEAADGIAARVQSSAFLGALIRYTVVVEDASAPGQELTIDVHDPHPDQFYSLGSLVGIQLPQNGVALLR